MALLRRSAPLHDHARSPRPRRRHARRRAGPAAPASAALPLPVPRGRTRASSPTRTASASRRCSSRCTAAAMSSRRRDPRGASTTGHAITRTLRVGRCLRGAPAAPTAPPRPRSRCASPRRGSVRLSQSITVRQPGATLDAVEARLVIPGAKTEPAFYHADAELLLRGRAWRGATAGHEYGLVLSSRRRVDRPDLGGRPGHLSRHPLRRRRLQGRRLRAGQAADDLPATRPHRRGTSARCCTTCAVRGRGLPRPLPGHAARRVRVRRPGPRRGPPARPVLLPWPVNP